jgi:hypothetical protein
MASPRSSDIDRSLAKLDALGDLDTLRTRAEALLAVEKPEPGDRYDGTDPTRSIWVAVDPRGLVLTIDITHTWRSRLEPDRFADALHGAYQAAVRTALTAELTTRRTRPTGTAESESPADPAGHSVDEWLAVTRDKLHRIDEQLRNLPTGDPVADREIRSPNGYLTLRLTAGSVTAITANTSALKWAKPDTLRKDATDAFRAADLTAER